MGKKTDRGAALVGMLCSLAILCSLFPAAARAQTPGDERTPIRVIVAPGLIMAAGAQLESGLGATAHLAVERSRHRILLRLAVIADVAGFPDGSGDGDLSELGMLYGRRGVGPGPGWSISAGASVVHFQRCPEEPVDAFQDPGCTTVGIPVVAEAGLGGRIVGLAIQLFGNLNAQAPFAGVGLMIPVGWMP